MLPEALDHKIERLIDDLIEDGGVATASLASILVAAQRAERDGYMVALCRRIWSEAGAQTAMIEPPSPPRFLARTESRPVIDGWSHPGAELTAGD